MSERRYTDRTVFRQRLLEVRTKRQLTQAELAQKAGLPPATISHFETGNRFPTTDTLGKLADALGVGIDYLVGRETEPGIHGTRYEVLFRHAKELSDDALEELSSISEILKQRARDKREKDCMYCCAKRMDRQYRHAKRAVSPLNKKIKIKVAAMVERGFTNKEISAEVNLPIKQIECTVKSTLRSCARNMGMRSPKGVRKLLYAKRELHKLITPPADGQKEG